MWFGADNVFPSPDHLPFLRSHFAESSRTEGSAKLPYLPLICALYYLFVGKKPVPAGNVASYSRSGTPCLTIVGESVRHGVPDLRDSCVVP